MPGWRAQRPRSRSSRARGSTTTPCSPRLCWSEPSIGCCGGSAWPWMTSIAPRACSVTATTPSLPGRPRSAPSGSCITSGGCARRWPSTRRSTAVSWIEARSAFCPRSSSRCRCSNSSWATGRQREPTPGRCLDLVEQGEEVWRERAEMARGRILAWDGDLAAARSIGMAGLAREEASGDAWEATIFCALLGFIELSVPDPTAALGYLVRANTHADRLRVRLPTVFRYLGDLVEAAVLAGDLELAEATLVERLDAPAARIPLPWILAVSARGRGHLAAARGETDDAIHWFDRSLDVLDATPMPFERARSVLGRGQARLRAGQRRLARADLDEARATFVGSRGGGVDQARGRGACPARRSGLIALGADPLRAVRGRAGRARPFESRDRRPVGPVGPDGREPPRIGLPQARHPITGPAGSCPRWDFRSGIVHRLTPAKVRWFHGCHRPSRPIG